MLDRYDFNRSEWEHFIKEWVFNEQDRKMLVWRLLDGLTIQELAERLSLSTDQTKRRLYRAQNRLFKGVDKSLKK